jgi:hypothetical protein
VTFRRALLIAAAIALAGVAAIRLRSDAPQAGPAEPSVRPAAQPSGPRIDAAQIATGRLQMERMPPEIGNALETYSEELVKNAERIETKQARITGTCAPGSAIRVIAEDGSVSCQRLPKGIASVTALAGVPRLASTVTAAGSAPGGVGRYQTQGEDDFLVVPVSLPDGAVVTSFSFVFWDAADGVDGGAYLYRSDDTPMALVPTSGAQSRVRTESTDQIAQRRIDASRYAYFVYFQVSARAGVDLMPISASITYRLP